MRSKIVVFFYFLFLFIIQVNAQNQDALYVNSVEGLRIRDNPDVSANVIGRLKHLDKVSIIDTDTKTVIIDEIKGNWKKVKTASLSGWVFGGYLENSIDKIKEINKISGVYYFKDYIELKKDNKIQDLKNTSSSNYYLNIKYIGNNIFQITFYADSDQSQEISYQEITDFLKNKKYFIDFGGDRSSGSFTKEFCFNTDGNIIYHYYEETQSGNVFDDETIDTSTLEYRVNFIKK